MFRFCKIAAARSAWAALLAAALVPAALRAQTADTTPPAAPTPPADQTTAPANAGQPPVAATPGPEASGNETIKLTPFEVSADQAKGYFTPNTTTGTRLSNNIGDIPSSVTVIDKQQLQDTNSQSINDIMLYEAGTQGSHTYTPVTGFSETTRIDDALAGSQRRRHGPGRRRYPQYPGQWPGSARQ